VSELSDRVLSLPRFDAILKGIAVAGTVRDLPSLTGGNTDSEIDWNHALLCASALTAVEVEDAQDAVLRVAQGCLRDETSSSEQRAAAYLLLQRVGNDLAIGLAEQRAMLQVPAFDDMPLSLALDAAVRHSELDVSTQREGDSFLNPFQKHFWDTVQANDWVSISAPTSAGKSHVVRLWLEDLIDRAQVSNAVYLAPTRALVEEVSASLRLSLPGLPVHTLPWDPTIGEAERRAFVMTQERLHLLMHRLPTLVFDVMFVDEAQKIGDGTRGVLLSQTLDQALLRNPQMRLVFASPLSSNPDVLLGGPHPDRRSAQLVSETVTVNQALVFAKQVPRQPRRYACTLHYRDDQFEVGQVALSSAPSVAERLPLIAVALGRATGGNLVYANGPADAEKYARRIYDELGPDADSDDDRIQELIDFAVGVVHPNFPLAKVAKRGVAYHYGDMPLVLKAKVESLFRDGIIQFLVCTSTLLEGVNLPCKNIFMRSPKKGRSPMLAGDFWNLAGRAGRWGKEFQGNIVCVDADDVRVWPYRPGRRERSEIRPAASDVFGAIDGLAEYVAQGAPKSTNSELESVYSWIAGRSLSDSTADVLPFGIQVLSAEFSEFMEAVDTSLEAITIDGSLVRKHAGISPLSIQRLYDAVLEHGRPGELALVPPRSDDAHTDYLIALDWVAEHLGGSFEPRNRRRSLARLIVHWMRGVPLSVIIDNRARNRRQRQMEVSYPRLIRETMQDVEDIARFEAPRYLSCYSDVVAAAARHLGAELTDQAEGIDMMLELGVPRITDMGMIAIGLSRATTMSVSSYLTEDAMTPDECLSWLLKADPENLDIPAFAIRELRALRARLIDSEG
jgi:hypothetical protein